MVDAPLRGMTQKDNTNGRSTYRKCVKGKPHFCFAPILDIGRITIMAARKTGVETSKRIASVASKGLRAPSTLTTKQIKQVSAAALANRQGPTVPKKK